MKQIKTLLASALTILLITGNNASYAAPHYTDFSGRFQDKKPDMNSGGRVMPKPNRLGDYISGYGFKNTLKKGDVFNGNVRMLPHRNNSEGRFNPTSKYSISDEPAFIPKPAFRINQSNDDASGLGFRNSPERGPGLHDSVHCINNSIKQIDGKNFACKNNNWIGPLGGDGVFSRGVNERSGVIIGDNHFKERVIIDDNNFRDGNDKVEKSFGGQEGEALDPTSKYSISDEPAFVPKPDSALGPDVVTTLEHGPGVASQPKGVLLKFINGEWIDP